MYLTKLSKQRDSCLLQTPGNTRGLIPSDVSDNSVRLITELQVASPLTIVEFRQSKQETKARGVELIYRVGNGNVYVHLTHRTFENAFFFNFFHSICCFKCLLRFQFKKKKSGRKYPQI